MRGRENDVRAGLHVLNKNVFLSEIRAVMTPKMENCEHSIAHETAGSSPAEAGRGEDIHDLACTLFWLESNHS